MCDDYHTIRSAVSQSCLAQQLSVMQVILKICLFLPLLLCLSQTAEWLGKCVKNSGDTISLPFKRWTHYLNKPDICIQECRDRGFAFAGVQNGDECHCGNGPPSGSSIGASSECLNLCFGDSGQYCGGRTHASVYETKSKKNLVIKIFDPFLRKG